MLSRLYAIFTGFLLVILAIGGYSSSEFMGADGLGWFQPTVWLLIGLVALAVGFFVRNVNTLRAFSGIVGALFLLWGAIALIADANTRDIVSTVLAAIGAGGVAAALAPAQWIREREVYAHG
ncbi:MAG: hypothetical protein ACYDCO_20225 [Armatimonadota bacterium]